MTVAGLRDYRAGYRSARSSLRRLRSSRRRADRSAAYPASNVSIMTAAVLRPPLQSVCRPGALRYTRIQTDFRERVCSSSRRQSSSHRSIASAEPAPLGRHVRYTFRSLMQPWAPLRTQAVSSTPATRAGESVRSWRTRRRPRVRWHRPASSLGCGATDAGDKPVSPFVRANSTIARCSSLSTCCAAGVEGVASTRAPTPMTPETAPARATRRRP